MHYRTDYELNPTGEQAYKLKNYVAGNAALVVTQAGLDADDRDLEAFAEGARHAKETRQHTISMAREHDIEDLASRARSVARDTLGGNWMIGVHVPDDDSNPHLHIAEFAQEERGTDFDIYGVRDRLENEFPSEPTAW